MYVNFKLIGSRIKELRIQSKMSQAQLSAESQLSTTYISYIETGKRKVSLYALLAISDSLGVTVDELLAGNQFHNPTDYQTDIDILLSDCSSQEKRFFYKMIEAGKVIIRELNLHKVDIDNF